MQLAECNPFVRAAEIQPAVLEGASPRMAYDFRLFHILDGTGEIVLQGRPAALSPDTLLCFRPETEYFFRGRMKVLVLNFDMTRACSARTAPLTPPPCEAFRPENRFDGTVPEGFAQPLLLHNAALLRGSLSEIVREFAAGDPCADALCSALLKQTLARIVRSGSPARSREAELADKLLFYIRCNAADIPDNAALGQAFGYHPVYLAAVFRRATGQSLHRAVLEEKIRLAARFLRQTDASVEQIAFDTGFSSRNHFCAAFRQFTGLSPRAWRSAAAREPEPDRDGAPA